LAHQDRHFRQASFDFYQWNLSALPAKADVVHGGKNVRFVPQTDTSNLIAIHWKRY